MKAGSFTKILPITTLFLGSGFFAGLAQASTSYDEAQVISSTAIYHVVESTTPTRQCWEEEVVRSESRRQHRSATPGLVGAVIGGAIGNAVGHNSSNKKVGTVVGAILGGSIAKDIAYENNRPVTRVDTVERCQTVYDTYQEEKLVGYDVAYRYNGTQHTVRMSEDPGPTVRVRVNVEPVL